VSGLVRIPLAGGGAIVVRAVTDALGDDVEPAGPVRAGRGMNRVRDGVVEASWTVQEMLAPVATMSRSVLDQFRECGPDGVEIEFGVELTVEAGAVLASASGACHLQVKLTWSGSDTSKTEP
jgi:hypothetical protein